MSKETILLLMVIILVLVIIIQWIRLELLREDLTITQEILYPLYKEYLTQHDQELSQLIDTLIKEQKEEY